MSFGVSLWTSLLFHVLAALSSAPTVKVGNTTIIGSDTTGQEFFGGLPFAEAPVENLRFMPPVLKKTIGTDATNFGPSCLQFPPSVSSLLAGEISEDCLTINVWRPAGILPSSKLPVMVWIYGGAFYSGSASLYNGSVIVAQSVERGTPIIYVNFNYRLGPLGFPQGEEADKRGALNLGLKDQLAALQWIQENIGAFGGDKTKVTVFGESAGAVSIGILYLNSNLENLAHAAIFESGSANTGSGVFNANHRQDTWNDFVAAVPECEALASTLNTFECLKNVSSLEILNAFNTSFVLANSLLPWAPTIDGEQGLLPDLPSKLWEKGEFSKLPFIAGTNLDEGTIFTPVTINSSDIIREWIITNYTSSPSDIPLLNDSATQILKLYPDNPALGSPFNTGNETFGLSPEFKRFAAILDDLLFQSVRRLWISQAALHNVKTFGYLFTDYPDLPPTLIPPSDGVFHGSEVLYIYPGFVPGVELSSTAQSLSAKMLDYWISFATSLDPNDGKGNERFHWPQYSSKNKDLLQLNSENTTSIPDDYRSEQIEIFNSHTELFRQ